MPQINEVYTRLNLYYRTLLKQGLNGRPTVKNVIVVAPNSLVKVRTLSFNFFICHTELYLKCLIL